MTTNLPKGFVTNSESVPGDIERIDTIDVEEISQLWRVYTTNKNVLQNDVGLRLENLFWRIWGNDRILGNIKGSTVAKLFIRISGAQTSKQNTLVQSPRSPRGLSEIRPACEARGPLTPPSSLHSSLQRNSSPHLDQQYGQLGSQASLELLPVPPVQQYGQLGSQPSLELLPVPPVQQWPSASPDRSKAILLPSILKRSRGDAAEGSTQVATLAVEDESSSSVSSAVDTAPRPRTPPKPRKDPAGGVKRKRASFVASTAASTRRKPALVKRKLSQSSTAGHTPSLILPRNPHPGQNGREPCFREFTANPTTLVSESKTRGLYLSPWDDKIGADSKDGRIHPALEIKSVDISHHVRNKQKLKDHAGAEQSYLGSGRPNPEASAGGEESRADWLVERDFRSMFVDKRHQERFSFLLGHRSTSKTGPTLAQSSMEATATIESGENSSANVLTRGKKMIVVDNVVPLKAEGLTPHRLLEGSGDPLVPLPRTKSQLTFLLERDRSVKAQEKQNNRKSSS